MGAVKELLINLIEDGQAGDPMARNELIRNGWGSFVGSPCSEAAMGYALQNQWGVIPQRSETKKPCVRWGVFKDELRRPSLELILDWYCRWPDAGVIVLLGPVSGLFAIDVDGKQAHRELVHRLGGVPKAPTSWRGKKFRYHLLFRHPRNIETSARYTPWHPDLEFRGHGGYIVVPPSLHESGQRYRWKKGRSPDELTLPNVPAKILDALRERLQRRRRRAPRTEDDYERIEVQIIPGVSRATRRFLSGQFANKPQWNAQLFAAACDLAGNNVEEKKATSLLLAAAGPWNDSEAAKALATIRSAYSQERVAARAYAQASKSETKQTYVIGGA